MVTVTQRATLLKPGIKELPSKGRLSWEALKEEEKVMSNTTWLAIFMVAAVVFYLNSRKKKLPEPPSAKRDNSSPTPSSDVPDGQYLAKYVGEQAEGQERIIISLEITDGKFKGAVVSMVFLGAVAERVLKEATGGFVSRLAAEDIELAHKLSLNITGHTDHSFLLRTKESKVVSVYTYNEAKIKTFMNKLAKDPSFNG